MSSQGIKEGGGITCKSSLSRDLISLSNFHFQFYLHFNSDILFPSIIFSLVARRGERTVIRVQISLNELLIFSLHYPPKENSLFNQNLDMIFFHFH